MKEELEIVRAARPAEEPLPEGVERLKQPTVASRRAVRELSDFVIHDALRRDDLPGLAVSLAKLMLGVAAVIDRYDVEPHVGDFVEAATALIEDARTVMDRGLTIQDWNTVKCGAVMLEITVRGIAAALNFPYSSLLEVAQNGGDARAVLVASGHLEAPQDGGALPAA